MAFDLDKLTLGELDFLEKTSGLGLGTIAAEDSPKGGFLMGLVVITKRRSGHPTYSTIEASQLSVGEAQEIIKVMTVEESAEGKESGATETPTSPPSSSTSDSDPTTTSA